MSGTFGRMPLTLPSRSSVAAEKPARTVATTRSSSPSDRQFHRLRGVGDLLSRRHVPDFQLGLRHFGPVGGKDGGRAFGTLQHPFEIHLTVHLNRHHAAFAAHDGATV